MFVLLILWLILPAASASAVIVVLRQRAVIEMQQYELVELRAVLRSQQYPRRPIDPSLN